MTETVEVANFSSVLEIAFGINCIFIALEIIPFIHGRWDRLEVRFSKTRWELWKKYIDEDSEYDFIKIMVADLYGILYIGRATRTSTPLFNPFQ